MESDSNFNFRAPQYLDSLETVASSFGDNDRHDSFFDDCSIVSDEATVFTPRKIPEIKIEKVGDEEKVEDEKKVEDNTVLEEVGIIVRATPGKKHSMVTRMDIHVNTPIRQLRSREVVLPRPGTRKRKAVASPCFSTTSTNLDTTWRPVLKAKKMMTLAEEIYHFHKDTPPRFRTKWKLDGPPQCKFIRLSMTEPQSPQLATRFRSHLSSLGDKAKASLGSLHRGIRRLPRGPRRTKIVKKEEPFIFKANPVPASTYVKEVIPIQQQGELDIGGAELLDNGKRRKLGSELSNTIYDRSQAMIDRKEEKIKKMRLEQSHRKSFHANPLPSCMSPSHSMATSVMSSVSRHSTRCNASLRPRSPFKAKFPSVLYKSPFVPKRASEEREVLTEIKEFNLNSEKRAKQRKEFERKLGERQEELRKIKEEVREQNLMREAREIKEWRKATVHKPLPLPHFIGKRPEENTKR
ncbi:hypothetical protein AAG570_001089 [Ranatra chinensis]|uniref:TPX2 C-terminal domain-containing protein n=1 Tax=Ranatra chinensis TaxID=642074 RepID=A0ABD0YXA8_9HEMI